MSSMIEDNALAQGADEERSLSEPLIALLKGVLYREERPELWQSLLRHQPRIHDYVSVLGLELHVDEGEGYAYLRQRQFDDDKDALPRLVHRRPLGFSASLLLALLRKKLVEHDAGGADPRLVLTKEQIVDMVRIFTTDTGDEVRLLSRIDADINRVVDLGFLRKLKGSGERYEVRRILASFVDAQWLDAFNERLAEYRQYLANEGE